MAAVNTLLPGFPAPVRFAFTFAGMFTPTAKTFLMTPVAKALAGIGIGGQKRLAFLLSFCHAGSRFRIVGQELGPALCHVSMALFGSCLLCLDAVEHKAHAQQQGGDNRLAVGQKRFHDVLQLW